MVGSFSFLSRYSVQGKSIIVSISRVEGAPGNVIPIIDDGPVIGKTRVGIWAVIYPSTKDGSTDSKTDLPCPYREIWRGF